MATFKSGPRDPVTGRSSARISPDNVVRSDGYTDRERAEISITPEDPRRQNQRVTPEGALNFQDFLSATGRSDKDPYGSSRGAIASGLSKLGTLDYRNNLSSGIISALNQQAYDKYLNPQRDGQMRSFRPGDLAFIDGRTQRAVRAPSTAEGIMRFMPTTRMLQGLFSPSVQFEPIGQGPATRGSRRPPSALEPTSAPQPGEVAPVVGDVQPSGFTLASTLPRQDSGIFNLPFSLNDLQKIPETGIGGFIKKNKDGFQFGPGKLEPEFNLKDKSFGLTFKMPISSQSVPDGGITIPDGMNPFRDILRTPVINPDVTSNMPVISEDVDKYRRRPLPGQERSMTPKMRDIFRFKSQFPAGV